ncbi:MAG: conserved rane protein of unknown function, partial [Modestobacter sp.]|nr:conserved rane protein of unknown function [Modestobacter sp.]
MFQRATRLIERARERIRAAEQDPHAWPDTRVVLVMDDELHGHLEPDTGGPDDSSSDGTGTPAVSRVEARTSAPDTAHPGAAPGNSLPTVGAPDTGAPDVDIPGGISGPPRPGGPAPRPGRDRSRGTLLGPDVPLAADQSVPNGLLVAAAWSWRAVAVVAA